MLSEDISDAQMPSSDFFDWAWAAGKVPVALFSCPGVGTWSVAVDWMHTVDLGVAQDAIGGSTTCQVHYIPDTWGEATCRLPLPSGKRCSKPGMSQLSLLKDVLGGVLWSCMELFPGATQKERLGALWLSMRAYYQEEGSGSRHQWVHILWFWPVLLNCS